MISVVICSLITSPEKKDILKRCVSSLSGADEIIVYAPTNYDDGFCASWNYAASLASGDYIVLLGDANIQTKGSIKDLAIENTVTSPLINDKSQEFWGFCFCIPRNIYEEYGLYDMIYNDGSHYMDEDLWRRYKKNGVSLKSVSSINFHHPVGGQTVESSPKFRDRASRNAQIFKERWKK